MARRQYVCRNCKMFTTEKECPNCKSKDLSASWKGVVVINKIEDSEIAKLLEASTPGKYALFVG
ncbi:MAG: transcription elongation factor Spt4 [Candidatus Aenigmarchaeota archaeon]|nr:transcription elongation factor Spt4 [Candidatus Aenigmarchaeota archaeon]